MGDEVTLTINGKKVTVSNKVTIVEAAKALGIDIPVFCYHPKMEPVGMCRMCLVEIGRPIVDRRTGEIQRESDGTVKIWFGPKLETACTTRVGDGMVVITNSEKVKNACNATLEFILTSHPLDCPICDKGGECPLQNLTMAYGSSQSRFLLEDKQHAAKRYPLGELIFLDRERCIKCGRCIRFQTEIVDDAVIGFYHRGRSTDIVTYSEPGFDSYFSGNTTDICPVGALTTVDFRFSARPWQMKQVASICNHCPVGCNIVFDTRREASSGGSISIKRVMPRQNEMVNEIWICDKGRFGYHHFENETRLKEPLVRKNGELVPVPWEEALDLVARKFKETGSRVVTLAGGSLANEDLYHLRTLTEKQGGRSLLNSYMAGGDLVA
ncbi:MAG: 2Fe-2S iron-sulfur cluster-binding protein, partial [Anaerolineaceae bacterium]|nr:2Fe-2S iron-sulfur cluster-binding protein [Anaerolineaceae bacterium]